MYCFGDIMSVPSFFRASSVSARQSVAIVVLGILTLLVPPTAGWTAEWIQLAGATVQHITPRRSGHAAFVHQTTPYVFGGYAEETSTLPGDTLHRFGRLSHKKRRGGGPPDGHRLRRHAARGIERHARVAGAEPAG